MTVRVLQAMSLALVQWLYVGLQKKKDIVAQSTVKAKYIALPGDANQALWLQKLLSDLGHKISSPNVLYCDNKSAIAIVENPVQHRKTKHIKVKYHSIRESEREGLIKVLYYSTEDQLADLMTKGLSKTKLEYLKTSLGMAEVNLKKEC